MKYWPIHLLVFVLLVSIVYAQEEILVICKDCWCAMKQEHVERIQQIVNDMVSTIEKLEGDNKRLRNTSGCS